MPEPRRPFISNPYNFQHLTHTGPAQAKALRTSNRDKLINEFSVIRASQAPKPQLKGIKADDIITIGTHTPSASRSPSPPQSNQDVTSDRNLRSIKSMDSFTRIASNSFSTPHPPISPPPPPRRSSRRQQNRTSQGLGLTKIDTSLVSDIPPSNTIINHSPKSSLAVVEESWISSQEIAQAVTTPDDSAQLIFTHQRTISTPVMLRDVLEERDDDEAVRLEKTEARIRELRRVKELRHAKSFPAQAISPSEFQTPQFGEEDIPARSSRRISADASQTNWEDDIDYCYQHAMEAIGYAWDEEAESSGIDLPTSFPNPYSGSFFMNSGTRNGDSATSSSLSVPGVTTPSDSRPTRDSNSTSHSLLFPLTPSGVSKEFNPRFPTEEQYQHRLMDIDSYSPTEASSRDSGSGISKWSSGESQSTRTGSVVAASSASSKHRSSDSIGSISDTSLYTISKRLTSTSVTSHDLVSSIPPPIPTLASRSRAASESTSKLLDLSMIGAPAPVAGNRTRAGSMASGRGRQSGMTTTTLGRPSYNLFPTVNTVHPLR